MSKQDPHQNHREQLRRFVRAEGRHTPPVFVGRESVIDDIEEAAKTTMGIWRDGGRLPGFTRLIQGAPGVGKLWVGRMSSGRMRKVSDVHLQTYNAIQGDAVTQYMVFREPLGDGNERIRFNPVCERPDKAYRDFYNFVVRELEKPQPIAD